MARKTETTQIGELALTTIQFPVLRAFTLATKLGGIILPALGTLEDIGGISLNSGIDKIAPAIAEVVLRVGADDAAGRDFSGAFESADVCPV